MRGKKLHKCEQCPAIYSRENMLAQHVKLVHAKQDDQGAENAGDLGINLGHDLGINHRDDERSEGPNRTKSGDRNGDEELAAKERELADKEAELRDYERIVEQSEEEAEKVAGVKQKLLQGLRTKYEYLSQKVGPEEAHRLFQKVTKECQDPNE